MRLLLNIDVPDLATAEALLRRSLRPAPPAAASASDALELLGADVPIYLLHKPAGTIGAGAIAARLPAPLDAGALRRRRR